MSHQSMNPQSKPKSKILFGANEPIFSKLPASVLVNLEHPRSENALLWNCVYPAAQPTISLIKLLNLPPLWGTAKIELEEDHLTPYFWGFSASGERLEGLNEVLRRIDGNGPNTEVDLFLVGKKTLLAVEGKHLGQLGKCSRYSHERCPEIHQEGDLELEPCRYWEPGEQEFNRLLDFGDRPINGNSSPPCNKHYQLARTFLVGSALAQADRLDFGLWMLVAKNRWRSLERSWLDFADRVRDDTLWRRMRVVAWEDVQQIVGKNHE